MPLRRPDIIVTGVGRSGTSSISRLLQEHFGILMAIYWEHSPPWNPEGSYEEQRMFAHSYHLVESPLGDPLVWLKHFQTLYEEHANDGDLLGIKQTPLSLCTREQWKVINPRLVIRTYRPMSPTVDSMIHWRYPKDRQTWEILYKQRESAMQKHLDWGHAFPVLRINFGTAIDAQGNSIRWTDEQLIDILSPWTERLKTC